MPGLKILEPQGESSTRVEANSGSIKAGSQAVPEPATSRPTGRMSAADRELLLKVDIDPGALESASQEAIDEVVRLAANVLSWQAQAEATELELAKFKEQYPWHEEFMQKLEEGGFVHNGEIDE
jgi:hypothetical protein